MTNQATIHLGGGCLRDVGNAVLYRDEDAQTPPCVEFDIYFPVCAGYYCNTVGAGYYRSTVGDPLNFNNDSIGTGCAANP